MLHHWLTLSPANKISWGCLSDFVHPLNRKTDKSIGVNTAVIGVLTKGRKLCLSLLRTFAFSFLLPYTFFSDPQLTEERTDTWHLSFPPTCTYTQGRVNIVTGCKMVCPYSIFFKLGVCQDIWGKALFASSAWPTSSFQCGLWSM